MALKTPDFWYKKTKSKTTLPFAQALLSPMSSLYQCGHKLKLSLFHTRKADIPVFCIGNITMGGSGKTPTCIAINELVKKHKLFSTPYFLTRGYGGTEPGPRRIEEHDTPSQVGDEPLLLASHSKTMVSKDRYHGAKKAQELGADCIIMDDGMQNLSLKKDISFLVIDGNVGLGNKKTFPAGPLREPLGFALKRTDAVIIIGDDLHNISSQIPSNTPIFGAHIEVFENSKLNKNHDYIAFAGLGIPDKFFRTLSENNYNVVDTYSFADHHKYTEEDILPILEHAQSSYARLITTEKDYVRLPKDLQNHIYMLPIKLTWNDEPSIYEFIKDRI